MTRNYNPYANDIQNYIKQAIKNAMSQLQTCIPAIVTKVISREQVIVSPAVQQSNPDWEMVPWANITLPIYTPVGGNGIFSMPVAVGDTGWVVAGDLDPSLFMKDPTRVARQNVFDRHNYQYGFFLPCKMNNFGISSDDDGGVVIKVGDTKVVIKSNEINIVSSNTLKVTGKSVSITSEGNSIEIDGVNFKNHTHDTKIAAGTALVDPNTGQTVSQITLTSDGVN